MGNACTTCNCGKEGDQQSELLTIDNKGGSKAGVAHNGRTSANGHDLVIEFE